MFDTLAYIPTVLACFFITLLLVILGFIVIYVTHKIYTTLYDNLPVAQLSRKSISTQQDDFITNSSDLYTLESKAEDQVDRKSKTALRIIVTLEPCYLAYMMFESKSHDNFQISNNWAGKGSQPSASHVNVLIKYFDNLASIPCSRDIQKCNGLRFNNLFNVRKSK